MDTDTEFYIAWLELQMNNDLLEKEWRDSRRGKKDGDNTRSGNRKQNETENNDAEDS